MYLSRCNMGMLSWWRAVESRGLAMKPVMVPASCTTLQPYNPLWSMLYPNPQSSGMQTGFWWPTAHRYSWDTVASTGRVLPALPPPPDLGVLFPSVPPPPRLPSPHSPINDAARKAQFHPVRLSIQSFHTGYLHRELLLTP